MSHTDWIIEWPDWTIFMVGGGHWWIGEKLERSAFNLISKHVDEVIHLQQWGQSWIGCQYSVCFVLMAMLSSTIDLIWSVLHKELFQFWWLCKM